MHEGAVCMEIMDIVSRAANANGLTKITDILLKLGPYSGLEMRQLTFYFDVAKEGTIMSEAILRMERDDTLQGTRQMFVKNICGA